MSDGEGINSCARGQASRQEVLRLFVQLDVEKREGWNSLSSSSSKHIGVICDGCQRTPIVGIRYKCLQCSTSDLCEECADQRSIHSEDVLAKILTPHQVRRTERREKSSGSFLLRSMCFENCVRLFLNCWSMNLERSTSRSFTIGRRVFGKRTMPIWK